MRSATIHAFRKPNLLLMKLAEKFILSRYVIREHIGPFFFSTSVITLIFLLNLVFRELSRILSKGLPFTVVVEFFTLNMAWILALSIPMAVLTAALMAFGRLASDNEITAMKANGISLYRIVTPALVAAALLAGILVWFNNRILPDMNHRTRVLAADIARKRPSVNLEPGVWFDELPNYGILVQSLDDSANVTRAREVLIADHSSLELIKTISARRANIYLDPATSSLVLLLFDGDMQEINIRKAEEFRRLSFPKHMITIQARDMFLQRSDSDFRGDREKSSSQMRREVAELSVEIQRVQREIDKLVMTELAAVLDTTFSIAPTTAPDTSGLTSEVSGQKLVYVRDPLPWRAFNLRAGDDPNDRLASASNVKAGAASVASMQSAQRLVLNSIDSHISSIRSYRHSMNSLLVEIHKKYSISVACIVFVLIGAPLGVLTRQSGMAVSGGMSLGFFLLYWSFLIAGEDLADRQMLSPVVAMWLANLVVGGFGIYVLIAVANERPFFDFSQIGQAITRLFRPRPRTTDHASS